MTANTSPIFTLTPRISGSPIDIANTARDGTGTISTIITGTTNGTRINRINIKASGSQTVAGTIRLFIYDGTTNFLWREVLVTAIIASGSVATFESITNLSGEYALILPNNYSLKASTNNAESFNIIAEGGDY
jgi:hypothetical protein